MNETLEQQIRRLEFCRNCIVLDYDAGKEEYNRLEMVIEELKKKKAEGYTIYICSASVEAYLRFCKLPVDEILGTKTVIKDGKYTSQMIGKNCKNEEKVKRIQEVIKNHNLEIDYDLSYAYSDSLHDIPMLKMVKNRIKIDTKDGHMSPFEIE